MKRSLHHIRASIRWAHHHRGRDICSHINSINKDNYCSWQLNGFCHPSMFYQARCWMSSHWLLYVPPRWVTTVESMLYFSFSDLIVSVYLFGHAIKSVVGIIKKYFHKSAPCSVSQFWLWNWIVGECGKFVPQIGGYTVSHTCRIWTLRLISSCCHCADPGMNGRANSHHPSLAGAYDFLGFPPAGGPSLI